MAHLARLIVLCMVVAFGAQAQTKDPVTGVIQSQIDAFLADDFATAFTYASPNIKSIFGSSERFGQMVRQGFPMVHRPAQVDFLDKVERGGRTFQTVQILDQRGDRHTLEYEMIPTETGWQINGVRFLRAPDLGA